MTKSKNTNCLEDIRCPKCGAEDEFKVRIEISLIVSDNGIDDEPGPREWNDDTVTQCTSCGHYSAMRDFRADVPQPEPDTTAQQESVMKNYDVLFAQDVPYYGSVLLEAENDDQALAKAKAYWQKVARDEAPRPFTDPQHDNAVLACIVSICDNAGREVATDIRLDEFLLHNAPTELDRRIFSNAKPIFDALQAVMHWWQNTAHTDDDMPAGLFDQAQSAIGKITGEGWRLFDFDGTGLLHIERHDSGCAFQTDADPVAYVRLLAATGDLEAERAIALHDPNQPKIDQLAATHPAEPKAIR